MATILLFVVGNWVDSLYIDDKSTILQVWIYYEVTSMICEPIWFQLFIPWLNKAQDDQIKEIYKDFKLGEKTKETELKKGLMDTKPSINSSVNKDADKDESSPPKNNALASMLKAKMKD